MASAADVAAQMVAALALSEPELDTSIGSPTRKILDAVAEAVAEAYVDQHLVNYVFDIDSKQGADLDDFVLLFGFTRVPAQRASGVVTMARPTAADQDYPIPAGTQVTTTSASPVVFATVAPAILPQGSASVDVPVQAVVGGAGGNLAANTLTRIGTPVAGVASVTNASPTSGGANTESDLALINRFKRTVFRSLAGTEDMFLGVALEDTTPDDTADGVAVRAKVVGASSHWREQVQVASGAATSSIPAANASYVYGDNPTLGPDIDAGQILTLGVHYSFNNTVVPPVVSALTGGLTDGSIYDLDFEYNSTASRNDPVNGITNRIDLWVDGLRLAEATETTYFRTARAFTATTTAQLYNVKFVRRGTVSTHPTVGNYFVGLAFGPIEDVPNTIVISGTTYVEGTDYWVVHDDTAWGYGPTSLFGLEWISSHAPPNNSAITLTYDYNALPRDVEARAAQWRLVTTDLRAHAAKRVYLRFSFAIVFSPGFTAATVAASVQSALAVWLASLDFDSPVQVSDVLAQAHAVQGVDNIRFLRSTEPISATYYAIERVTSNGTHISYVTDGGSPARAADLQLGDNEVPLLYEIRYTAKAANTFGGA
jgi:baseplate J-like protein